MWWGSWKWRIIIWSFGWCCWHESIPVTVKTGKLYRFLLSTAFVQHTTVKNNKRRSMWNYSFWKTKFVQIVSIEEEAQRLSSGNICWNFGFWTYFIVKTWKTLTVNRQCKYLHLMTQSEISFYITSNGQSSKFRTNQTLVASCWS